MRFGLTVFCFLWLASALDAQPRTTSVYVYSRDSEAGLNDDKLDMFRRELGKYAEPAMAIGYSREEADVSIQFLGAGSLTVVIGESGAATSHHFVPGGETPHLWVIVRRSRLPGYAKEFTVDGAGGRDVSRLAKDVGDWIRDNASQLSRRSP